MREEKRVIIVDPDVHNVMVKSITESRNYLLEQDLSTEDVGSILMIVIDVPMKEQARRAICEAR